MFELYTCGMEVKSNQISSKSIKPYKSMKPIEIYNQYINK